MGSLGQTFEVKKFYSPTLFSNLKDYIRADAPYLNFEPESILHEDLFDTLSSERAFLDVFSYVKDPHDIIGKDLLLSMHVHDDSKSDVVSAFVCDYMNSYDDKQRSGSFYIGF